MKKLAYKKNRKILFLPTGAGFLFLLAVATFFRFFRLSATQNLVYDQARDFLIIKKLIFDRKLTLVGPTVLIPGVYLPPFYYYTLAPFLFIFGFHLLGADVYTAAFGVLAVIIFYFLVKKFFGSWVGFLSALVYAVLPLPVAASRHAWNPNSIQFYSVLIVFFLINFREKGEWKWFYFGCFFLSWGLSFHYSILGLTPLFIYLFFKNLKKSGKIFKKIFLSFIAFLLPLFPLVLFELRHGWGQTRNLLDFLFSSFDNEGGVAARFLLPITDLIKMPFFLYVGHFFSGIKTIFPSSIIVLDKISFYHPELSLGGRFYCIFILLVICFTYLAAIKRFSLPFFWFLGGVFIRIFVPSTSFYFYHYTFLFPAIVFWLAGFLKDLERLSFKFFGFFIVLVIFLVSACDFLSLPDGAKSESYYQEAVGVIAADFEESGLSSWAVAAKNINRERWERNGLEYRYFLEAFYNLPSSGWNVDDYGRAQVLYLVDETGQQDPWLVAGMEIESFSPKEIAASWDLESGGKIYKLVK